MSMASSPIVELGLCVFKSVHLYERNTPASWKMWLSTFLEDSLNGQVRLWTLFVVPHPTLLQPPLSHPFLNRHSFSY